MGTKIPILGIIKCWLVPVIQLLGKKAEKNMLPLQPGDVPDTFADTKALVDDVGYQPATTVEVGVKNFVDWYVDYYKVDLN